MAVKLLIDSASDISDSEAKALGITMVPMAITFGEEEYYDGVSLLPNEFYDKLVVSKVLPKTSQINAYRFEEEFEKLTKNGDEVVAIVISSRLSGTYNSALQAASKFEDKVHVIDSLQACVGERLLAQYALQLINQGKKAQEIVEELEKVKTKIQIMAMVDTLEYLKKGGRISAVVAFAGKLLSIKPVVALIDGEVKMVRKAMGTKKGEELLNNTVKQRGGIDEKMPHGFLWSGNDKTRLERYIANNHEVLQTEKDAPTYILGGTIGTHVGPGAIGVAYFSKN